MFQYIVNYRRKSFSQLYLTKYTSKNTLKTLNILSDVRKVKYREKKSPENWGSQEAIKVQMDMSHMRWYAVANWSFRYDGAFGLNTLTSKNARWCWFPQKPCADELHLL